MSGLAEWRMIRDGIFEAPAMVSGEIECPMKAQGAQPAPRHDIDCHSPGPFDGVSIPPSANVPCTPHRAPADLAFGGSRHTDTTNSCPTRSASVGDLRGDAVRLMKRCGRHGLCRRGNG